eukprot:CAMPEP_0184307094 /NCGR_PEP_ID=MMETSP1049-20130417/15922_1 /TAXON_ID=77928 /ORGANISM="Proteomonas sulcata, Strain CCMP704" /LENGTH=592 /DNA_ID=CAMNT_0026619497 /DNA_START=40 /DNA_END=1818 /DNA_ORIENTATION=+
MTTGHSESLPAPSPADPVSDVCNEMASHMSTQAGQQPMQADEAQSIQPGNARPGGKRLGRMKACQRCRAMKLKCDGDRPCHQCKKHNCCHNCRAESDEKTLQSERVPAGFVVLPSGEIQGHITFKPKHWKMEVPTMAYVTSKREIVKNVLDCSAAVAEQPMQDYLDAFTDDLYDTVLEGVEAIRLVAAGNPDRAQLRKQQALCSDGAARPIHLSLLPDEVSPDWPYYCDTLDLTMMRSVAFGANRMMAKLMNTSPEEMIGRVASLTFDFSDLGPELEVLSQHLNGLAQTFIPETFIYTVMPRQGRSSRLNGHGMIVKIVKRRQIAADGLSLITHTWTIPVSPEEFDKALQTTPNVCRPFMSAIGDSRSARQLLADYPVDSKRGIKKLVQTPHGRAKIQGLAEKLKEQLAPTVMAAKALQEHQALAGQSPQSDGLFPSFPATVPTGSSLPSQNGAPKGTDCGNQNVDSADSHQVDAVQLESSPSPSWEWPTVSDSDGPPNINDSAGCSPVTWDVYSSEHTPEMEAHAGGQAGAQGLTVEQPRALDFTNASLGEGPFVVINSVPDTASVMESDSLVDWPDGLLDSNPAWHELTV